MATASCSARLISPFRPGAFHFLTGPSGSGKTTLLKLCYGDLQPTSGRVEVFGTSLRDMSRDALAAARRRIGVVHQDCTFLDHLTVAENVVLPYVAAGRPIVEADRDALLAWVGLEAQADALPPTLSGGERQRLALARAVILSPEVVLADEPTGNIDWDMSMRLLGLLVELNRMGTAVMIATHDLQLIRAAKAQVSVAGASNQRRVFANGGGRPVTTLPTSRVVPGSGYTAALTWFTAAAMAFLAVFALALAVSAGRLADRWAQTLAQTATLRIAAPARRCLHRPRRCWKFCAPRREWPASA
jgi:cell division transport system ATP-binding protein